MRWRTVAAVTIVAGVAWAATRERPPPLDVDRHLEGGRLLPLWDGRVYLRSVGRGPDLVLLPGFAGNSQTWRFLTPCLARQFRVHWLDMLGHGLADKPADADYGAVAQAARLERWLDLMDIPRAIVMASSAGAQAAVALAVRAPQRIRALVLIDPFLTAGRPLRLVLQAAARLPRASGMVLRLLFRQRWFVWLATMLGRAHPLTVDAETVDLQYRTYGTPGFFDALPGLVAGVQPEQVRDAIGLVQCPTLLVWGQADRTARLPEFRALAAQFGNAEFLLLPSAGHVPQEETPQDLWRAIQPFLRRLRA